MSVLQVFHLVHLECPSQVEDAREDPAAKKTRHSKDGREARASRDRDGRRSSDDGMYIYDSMLSLCPSCVYVCYSATRTNKPG